MGDVHLKGCGAGIDIGCDVALLEMGGVPGFKIDCLPDAAGAGVPVGLFADGLFAVVLGIVGAHDDVGVLAGYQRIGDVEFKGEVSVLVFAEVVSVHPDFGVPVNGTEVEDDASGVPCLWHGYGFSVPADGVSGRVAVVPLAFKPAAGDFFGVEIGVGAEIGCAIGCLCLSPGGEAFPRIGHLYLQGRVGEGIGCEPVCVFAGIARVEGEVPGAVEVYPIDAFRGASLEIGARVFGARFFVVRNAFGKVKCHDLSLCVDAQSTLSIASSLVLFLMYH